MIIQLLDMITEEPRVTGATEFGLRGHVSVWRTRSEVEKEGLGCILANKIHRLIGQHGVHLVLNTWLRKAFWEVTSWDNAKFLARRAAYQIVILDESSRRIVVIGRHAEMVVKAQFQRPGDR